MDVKEEWGGAENLVKRREEPTTETRRKEDQTSS
jgi:hypothetical protein